MKKITGKTATGFQFSIDAEALDDMELLEELGELTGGNMEAVPKVLTMFLGEKQKAKLYEHCRAKSGRVLASKVVEELNSIFTVAGEENSDVKN